MATPPDGDEDTLSVSTLKAGMRRALENGLSRQKQKARVKRGVVDSKRVLRLSHYFRPPNPNPNPNL